MNKKIYASAAFVLICTMISGGCTKSADNAAQEDETAMTIISGAVTAPDENGSSAPVEKITPDRDFALINGIKMGMTIDEVKAVLGEPDEVSEDTMDGLITASYGKNILMFGSMTADEDYDIGANNTDTDDGEPGKLSMIAITESGMDCFCGIDIGTPGDEIISCFRSDSGASPDNDDDSMKMIYGHDAYLEYADENSGNSRYMFAYEVTTDDNHALSYFDASTAEDEDSYLYSLMFFLDDDEKLSYVTVMYLTEVKL